MNSSKSLALLNCFQLPLPRTTRWYTFFSFSFGDAATAGGASAAGGCFGDGGAAAFLGFLVERGLVAAPPAGLLRLDVRLGGIVQKGGCS